MPDRYVSDRRDEVADHMNSVPLSRSCAPGSATPTVCESAVAAGGAEFGPRPRAAHLTSSDLHPLKQNKSQWNVNIDTRLPVRPPRTTDGPTDQPDLELLVTLHTHLARAEGDCIVLYNV